MTGPHHTITPVNCGILHGTHHGNHTLGTHIGDRISVPTLLWLVQGGGRTVVVDSGPGEPASIAALTGGGAIDRAESVADALARHGIDPLAVQQLVLSHLHWDHTGGLALFPNAELLVQRRELIWAIAPLPAHSRLYEWELPGPGLPTWLRERKRMQLLDGDTELAPGLALVTLPGHSAGLMGLRVDTVAGRYLIASDAVPTFENIERLIPPGLYVDLADSYHSFDRIRGWGDTVLPSHDLRVLDQIRYPC